MPLLPMPVVVKFAVRGLPLRSRPLAAISTNPDHPACSVIAHKLIERRLTQFHHVTTSKHGRRKLYIEQQKLPQEEVRYGNCPSKCERVLTIAGVLGATGSVGQRFILLLQLHPHFVLHAVGASERSAGKKYKDAVKWKQALPFSERIGDLVVKKCTAEEFADCDLVFSGLDSDVAGDVGMCDRLHMQNNC